MNVALIVGAMLVCLGAFSFWVVRRWTIDGTFSVIILKGAVALTVGALLVAWYFAAKL